jgi:hypothetical protein
MFHVNRIILEEQSFEIYNDMYSLMQELNIYINILEYTMFIFLTHFVQEEIFLVN